MMSELNDPAAPPPPGGGGRPPSPMAFASVGIEILVSVVLFMYLGYRADGWLGTRPALFIVGALLGFAIVFYSVFRRVRRIG